MNFIPKTIKFRNNELAWQKKYNINAPKKGALAPDFELADVDCKNTVQLSDFRDQKPVALIFGSFT
jgi:peroxiredoxin